MPEARASQKLAIIDAGITTNTGATRLFKLELAETPAQRTKGLMGRKTLADNGGMLFVWPQSALRLFWMKNTLLSLDILFFNVSGELVYMHQAAKPFSLETISSIEPAKYVVEIKAGTAKLLGIDSDAKLILKQPLPPAR
ncbi:MAG: DUF192 domain-containing protein [Alphaproteobacteria bacterium]|nr:DUF192 domain-containing protein [Alphaproteobacteria bacterium]